MQKDNNRSKGKRYEEAALNYLQMRGYRLLERNYLRKSGEIDLIVESPEGIIVFVEVKFRRNVREGYPEEAVTRAKQKRIYRTAQWFLTENGIFRNRRCRFDVIGILNGRLRHVINAFGSF